MELFWAHIVEMQINSVNTMGLIIGGLNDDQIRWFLQIPRVTWSDRFWIEYPFRSTIKCRITTVTTTQGSFKMVMIFDILLTHFLLIKLSKELTFKDYCKIRLASMLILCRDFAIFMVMSLSPLKYSLVLEGLGFNHWAKFFLFNPISNIRSSVISFTNSRLYGVALFFLWFNVLSP